jgi:methylenetetrahydrofolate reductase (NADPH)
MTRLPFAPDIKITDLLKASPFTISAEVIPPRNGASQADVLNQISSLVESGSQFLAVTKGAGGSLRGGSLPIAQLIKESFRTPCIAHFTCRDLAPEEVENQIMDHHYFGIRNILGLRGDPPTGQTEWEPRPQSYNYAYQLIEQIRALNEGRYLERKNFKVEERDRTDFCIGAAAYPDHPEPEERIEFFCQKISAGAEYGITQMLFSYASYADFIEKCARRGQSVPILPGTRILKSQAQALRMADRFQVTVPKDFLKALPEDEKTATPEQILEPFLRLTEQFKSEGAPGLHLFVLSDTKLCGQALRNLRQAYSSPPRTDTLNDSIELAKTSI